MLEFPLSIAMEMLVGTTKSAGFPKPSGPERETMDQSDATYQ
ncbi:hypothetical protein [Paracoccus beibuensis]|nr:hypothetical protein [Paracoccus beibuensis]